MKKNRRHIKFLSLCGAMLLSAAVSGCQLYDPVVETQLYPIQMKLQQEMTQTPVPVAECGRADPEIAQNIAEHYEKAGEGAVTLTLRYPAGNSAEARRAGRAGANYKKLLEEHGIRDVSVDMLPLSAEFQDSVDMTVNYHAWKASAPVGCGPQRMPGIHGTEGMPAMSGYKIGCETETYISRMVARPKDLKGRAGLPDGDSQREGMMQEDYRDGVPNAPLEGFSASGFGGN